MKILRCIYSTNPAGGGPIEGIKQFAAGVQPQGSSVEVMSLDGPGAAHLKDFPLPVHPLGPVATKYGFSNRVVPWLKANAGSFDAIVVDGVWQYHSVAVWRATRNLSTPYVVLTHGMLDPWFQRTYPLKHLKKIPYWLAFERRVLRDAAAVVFMSEEECILARGAFPFYRANERIVYPGTTSPTGDGGQRRELLLQRFPELRGKRLVTFLGRLHPKKGCDLLLHAFAQTFSEDLEWHLLIAGPDQVGWQSELQRIASRCGIAHRVTWGGMVSDSERWAAYQASDIFVLPSHQENFGITVAEAMAYGVPVVLSDKVNIWREVTGAGAGFAANDDVAGTAASLQRWKNLSPAAQAAMRKAARECFLTKFDNRVAARKFLDLLESLTFRPVVEAVHA